MMQTTEWGAIIIGFFGGLAIFLFGMGLMTHALKGDEVFGIDQTIGDDDLTPWDSRNIGSARGGGANLIDLDGLDVDVAGAGGGFVRVDDEFRFVSQR